MIGINQLRSPTRGVSTRCIRFAGDNEAPCLIRGVKLLRS
jgi:hypothetical protein